MPNALDIQEKGENGLQPTDCGQTGPEKEATPVLHMNLKSLCQTLTLADLPPLTCSPKPDNITAFPLIAFENQQGVGVGAAGMFAVVEKGSHSGVTGKILQHDDNICLMTVIDNQDRTQRVRVDIDYVKVSETYEGLFYVTGHEDGPENAEISKNGS